MPVRSDKVIASRPALLRLEDVGPGGAYATIEDLGRLRAIFEYLRIHRVPFHIALIPRWIRLQANQSWYNKGIDDLYPDDYVRKFNGLMLDTQQDGALFGMHGYTHQYGKKKMEEDNQDSAIGFEFDVKEAPVTSTAAYAVDRITRSLTAFRLAGLYPHFWESPHYRHSLEQERIFARYMPVIYQSDVLQRAEDKVYVSESGTSFIPTPLGYINEQNTVDQVLSQLDGWKGLASLFYHPFLEFSFLEPQTDFAGHSAFVDGLPVYRYKSRQHSNLHKLIRGFRQKGYHWVSIHSILPTTV